MVRRDQDLISQIERDALDDKASLSKALRRCVILGGKSGSEPLRDWATRELRGYDNAELPDYRRVPAQIQIDGATFQGIVRNQPIGRSMLPDFVQETVKEEVELREGVGALEALVTRAEGNEESIKLSLPMGGDIARLMTADADDGSQIMSVYWALSPVALSGVLDQIRTALTMLVAELRASMPPGESFPTANEASQAVQLIVTGKRNSIHVNAATGSIVNSGSDLNREFGPAEAPFWTHARRVGAAAVGLAAIVTSVAGVIALD